MQYEEKVIPNFPNYTIDTNCVVRNKKRNTVLNPMLTSSGYHRVVLYNDYGPKYVGVHRIFMETFHPIPNMDEMVVNHIDGVRDNNTPSNLEWLTQGDNIRYGYVLNLPPTDRRVDIMDVNTGEVLNFDSHLEAARHIDVHRETIIRRLRTPNDAIYPGGWRLKHPDDEWMPIDNGAMENYFNGGKNKVEVYNFYTLTDAIYNSQQEVCILTGFSPSYVSEQINSGRQAILPGMWVIKKPEEPWRVFGDPWLEYEHFNIGRPVICTYPNGYEEIFESLTDCVTAIGIGKSTAFYRLDNGLYEPGRNGYAFEYYSDRVRRLGN